MSLGVIIFRLILVAFLCGVLGLERLIHHRPLGLRTNALVGIGTVLMTLTALVIAKNYPDFPVDVSRIPAYVLPGIGFLGAGTIIQTRGSVIGLTTAATLWVAAGIGIAVGVGLYWEAILTTLIVLIILSLIRPLEKRIEKKLGVKGDIEI